jgi:eukaryotic-like serine/threonine-protein kinase
MIGQTLGHYRVLEKIGAGGMGVVYRANDQRLDRNVALKILPPGTLADEAARRRFRKEALALARLSHPNIGVIHDFDAQDGVDFLVMEYIPGTTLDVKLAACGLPEKEVVALGAQIAAALEEAHEHGVVHSDLKPGNVMVTPKGLAKVLDFGLAKLLRPPSDAAATESFTETPAAAGTLPYMAPEQLRGESVDARTDIHALGALLYQMATGQRSYNEGSTPRLIDSILHQAPVPPRALNPRTSPALEHVILKCLEKDPESRYQSAKEVAVDLRRLSAPSAVTAAPAAVPQPVWRRHWALAAMVALLFMVVVGALVLFQFLRPAGPARLEYTQLTNFADSVVAPALSPDGRMLAFIRGEDTFVGPGEIYVKLLPDGEPVQLTHDSRSKMGPLVFSPDGSRIAYSAGVNDTWAVPVLGGEPSHLLANAGGLSWIGAGAGQRQIMFSATTGQGIHMGVYTSTESRAEERTVYMPTDVNGMAHRSFLSPDRQSVLTVEMDMSGWLPCRVVPFDGSSLGKRVGREPALCTDAAWSPDGKWMYFSANTGDGFHVWRQLYPDGAPEQVTSGATEEQGVAFAPDGRSFVTSIGERQSTIWLHDSFGDKQITSQGYAFLPSFSSDGKRLYYLQRSRTNRRFVSGELWVVNLETHTRERLLPDFLMEHYNVAADDNHIVFVAVDDAGHAPVWITTLDARSPPRRLSSFDSVRAMFGIHNDVFFVGGETIATSGLYHVNVDGSGLQQVVPNHVLFLYDVSPDGKWLAAWEGQAVILYSTDGASRRLICDGCATAGGEDRGLTPPLGELVTRRKTSLFAYHRISSRHRITQDVRDFSSIRSDAATLAGFRISIDR